MKCRWRDAAEKLRWRELGEEPREQKGSKTQWISDSTAVTMTIFLYLQFVFWNYRKLWDACRRTYESRYQTTAFISFQSLYAYSKPAIETARAFDLLSCISSSGSSKLWLPASYFVSGANEEKVFKVVRQLAFFLSFCHIDTHQWQKLCREPCGWSTSELHPTAASCTASMTVTHLQNNYLH